MINKKVYVVIVTYNGMRWMERCLSSLKRSNYGVTVIIIDNLSTDGTSQYIKDNYPLFDFIQSDTNLGFGRANNIGIRKALGEGADYVFLLNQDAWVEADTVRDLLDVHENNLDFGILSPMHLSVSGGKFERQFTDFLGNGQVPGFINDCFFSQLKQVYATQYIHAAAWFMSRVCIEKVGGFDPIYRHYGEDDDYLQRVFFFGFKVGLVPHCFITHDAVYKPWEVIEWDRNRVRIMALQQLKRVGVPFRSSLLLFVKGMLDELSTLLLLRKWKKLKFKFSVYIEILKSLKTIKGSYKQSHLEGSFL